MKLVYLRHTLLMQLSLSFDNFGQLKIICPYVEKKKTEAYKIKMKKHL